MKSALRRAILIFMLVSCVVVPSIRADRATQEETEAADADMNKVYKKALAAMPDNAAKANLREAQRAWIAFRDAEMNLLQTDGFGGNTGRENHMTDLNTARTKQLQDLIDLTH